MEKELEYNGINLYFGIVESRDDPLELGRYRVRIFGIHSPDKTSIPTESLPLAPVMLPVTSAGHNGVGQTPKLIIGSHVAVTFLDGQKMQKPFVIGSVAGIREDTRITINGTDVPGNNPGGFPANADSDYISQSSLPRNARSGATNRPNLNVSAGPVSEPQDLRHKRQYPYSQVRQSESGHSEEWDDTPGNERILTQHRSGTFQEIRPDGSQVNKIFGDGYEIIAKDKNVIVKGTCNIVIENDCNFKVGGDLDFDVSGSINLNSGENINMNANKGIGFVTNGNWSEHIVGDKKVSIGDDEEYEVGGDKVVQVGGTRIDQVIGDKNLYVAGAESKTIYGNASEIYGANHSTLVFADEIQSFNAGVSFSVFGNYTASVQGAIDMSSLGTLDLGSTGQMSINGNAGLNVSSSSGAINAAASTTIQANAGGAIAIDGTTVDINSKVATASTAEARAVSIIEEDVEIFNQTKPDEELIPVVNEVSMEFGDVEIFIDEDPEVVNSSSGNKGFVSAEDYDPRTYGGKSAGGSGFSNTSPNSFNEHYYDGNGRNVSKYDNIIYRMNGRRNKVVNSDLEEILSIAAKETGVDSVVITSGKQPGTRGLSTGSYRHNTGWAVDCYLEKDGNSIYATSQRGRGYISDFVRACVALGVRAGGMGTNYMGDRTMHLDTLGSIVSKQANGVTTYNSGSISTWKSSQWFIDAMHNPRTDLQPTASFINNSQTPNVVGTAGNVNENNVSPSPLRVPASKKLVALHMAKNLREKGFNDQECLAAIAVAYNERGMDIGEETSYHNTSNERIRTVFKAAKNLSDAELNQIKASPFTFFEWAYNSSDRLNIKNELGNTEKGDGYKYRGRGLIQHTGKYAYDVFAKNQGYSDLVDSPDKLSSDWETAVGMACGYLKERYKRDGKYANKDILWRMAKAVKGNTGGVNLSREKDLKMLQSLDSSWLYPEGDLPPLPKAKSSASETTAEPTSVLDTKGETPELTAAEASTETSTPAAEVKSVAEAEQDPTVSEVPEPTAANTTAAVEEAKKKEAAVDKRAVFEQDRLGDRFKGIEGADRMIRQLNRAYPDRKYEAYDTGIQATPYEFNFYKIRRVS